MRSNSDIYNACKIRGHLLFIVLFIHVLFSANISCDKDSPNQTPKDSTPPSVISAEPPNNAAGVELDAVIKIVLSEAFQTNDLDSCLSINPALLDSTTDFLTWDETHAIYLNPAPSGWTSDTTYTVRLHDIRDLAGNVMPEYIYRFHTVSVPDSIPEPTPYFSTDIDSLLTVEDEKWEYDFGPLISGNQSGIHYEVTSSNDEFVKITNVDGTKISGLNTGNYNNTMIDQEGNVVVYIKALDDENKLVDEVWLNIGEYVEPMTDNSGTVYSVSSDSNEAVAPLEGAL
ncbi:MAG: Ig-like domain-containing protein, partial [candidate division KSB1 bacterium]|nr:Ig-like domain-containing protein [candidate division KSB1 bacterium]